MIHRSLLFLLSSSGLMSALTPLSVHIDLEPTWTGTAWEWTMRTDDGNRDPNTHFLPVRPQSYEDGGGRYIRPDNSVWNWNFLGVSPGEPIWFLHQTQNPNLQWPGLAAENPALAAQSWSGGTRSRNMTVSGNKTIPREDSKPIGFEDGYHKGPGTATAPGC